MSARVGSGCDVVVIGAGLSGLVAATTLAEAGAEVTVVESTRRIGGRLATRHLGAGRADHGAQFFTARSEAFRAQVDHWVEAGVATQWCRGFESDDGHPRFCGTEGMGPLAHHLAESAAAAGATIVTGQRAQSIVGTGDGWTVIYDGATRLPDEAAAVIVSPPTPVALELLRSGGLRTDELGLGGFEPVIGLLVTAANAPDLGPAGARQWPDGDPFTFVADNAAKGISPVPVVTFHVAHARSRALWSATDAEVWAALAAEVESVLSGIDVVAHQVIRWPNAAPTAPIEATHLVVADSPGPLVLVGDAFAGAKVEGAWSSGVAGGRAVIEATADHTSDSSGAS